jgi:hypothetical protein
MHKYELTPQDRVLVSGIAPPLIEGLRNEVICKEDEVKKYVPISKTSFAEAVMQAHSEEKKGPGITGF